MDTWREIPVSFRMQRAIRIALTTLAAIAALSSSMWLLRESRNAAAEDFYHYWLQAQLSRAQRMDPYSQDAQQHLGEQFFARALYSGSDEQLRDATIRRRLDTTATPFLYTTMRWIGADYDRALAQFRLLLVLAFSAAVLLLGMHARLPWAVTLFLLAVLLRFDFPVKQDVFLGNVTALQLLGIALFVVAGARFPAAGGAILGLTIMFKPNLAIVVIVIAVSRIAMRDWARLRREVIGGAIACIAAFACTSPRLWMDWMDVAADYALRLPPRWLNVAPLLPMYQGYGPERSLVVTIVLTGIACFAVAWRRRRDDLFAIGLGIMIALLAPASVWVQYEMLTIPLILALIRQRWVGPIAAVCAIILAIEPVEWIAGKSLLNSAATLTGTASVLLFACGVVAAFKTACPAGEHADKSVRAPARPSLLPH